MILLEIVNIIHVFCALWERWRWKRLLYFLLLKDHCFWQSRLAFSELWNDITDRRGIRKGTSRHAKGYREKLRQFSWENRSVRGIHMLSSWLCTFAKTLRNSLDWNGLSMCCGTGGLVFILREFCWIFLLPFYYFFFSEIWIAHLKSVKKKINPQK